MVVAIAPGRIVGDRPQLHRGQPDLLGRRDGAAGQHDRARHPVGPADGPLQRPHPAHRPADHRRPAPHADGVGEGRLGGYLVGGGDLGPAAAPGSAVRCGGGGSRRALAAAEDVGAHDEQTVGVEDPPWPDQAIPPAFCRMPGAGRAGGVAVAGEGVQDEHRVAGRGVQASPGLVGDPHTRQLAAELQAQRAGQRGEAPLPDRIDPGPPRPGDGHGRVGGWRPRRRPRRRPG